MSNYLAIATVTATLQKILQRNLQVDVEGARVTTTRPENTGGTPETGISLYLYHLKRNTALGNADMPPRQRKGELTKRNQLPLDLYYLISCHGNDVELEPQRLLGSAMRSLEDRAVLSAATIREAVTDPNYPFLAKSDLSEQIEMIRAEFVPISTDELSKVWSVFFQTPYSLSVIYKITVVVLEGEDPAAIALPVRDRRTIASVFSKQPTIDLIVAAEGRYLPILSHNTLTIRGRRLANAIALVRICGVEVVPTSIQDTELTVPISLVPAEVLRAGVQGLQVIHGLDRERDAVYGASRPRLESNVAPFVLCPTIEEVNLMELEDKDDDLRNAEIEVVVDVIVGQEQRVVLIMNERASLHPVAYTFNAKPRNDNSTTLTFSAQGVKMGEYLVRIQVDGAESQFDIDGEFNSPTFEQYISPLLTIR